MRRVALLLALGASGCRVETPPPEAPRAAEAPAAEAPAAEAPAAEAPLDTVRFIPTEDVPARAVPVEPGRLVVPVVGVQRSDLVDTFDDARSEGRVHDAIDIPAPRGTPVVAAAGGTVARLFESERGGHTVYVLDGLTVYYYAHLDATAPGLAAGQTVRAGQAVGTVGSTGNALPEAPHLHFAVWRAPSADRFWDGDALNPYPLLTAPRQAPRQAPR